MALLAASLPAATVDSDPTPATQAESLRIRQLRVGRYVGPLQPGQMRHAICWEFQGGTWKGQNLEGLTCVLVQRMGNTPSNNQTVLYVSLMATPEQRLAATDAVMSIYGDQLSAAMRRDLRTESAAISMEQTDDQSVVLHLAPLL
jgi:hypothetical protein